MLHVQEVVRPLRLLPFIIPICFALASSLSWCGNARSIPPERMSIYLPSVSDATYGRAFNVPPRPTSTPGARPAWLPRPKSAQDHFSATFFVKAPSPSAESGWLFRFHGSSLVYVFPAASNVSISKCTEPSEVCSISELFLNNPTHKLDNQTAILRLTRINSSGSSTLRSRSSCINRSSYLLVRSVNIE